MNVFNNFLKNYKKSPNKIFLQLKNLNKDFTYSDIYTNTLKIIYLLKDYRKKKSRLDP